MDQPLQLNIQYPFANNNQQLPEDAQSYHSITTDDKKLSYFEEHPEKSNSRISQSNIRRKNPLPPSYPYQEVKKLKQSIRVQNKSKSIADNQSINSFDSFHTANEFQSICYEEGDFQKVMQQMQSLTPPYEQVASKNNQQNDFSNKENHPSSTSFKSIKFQQNQTHKKIQNSLKPNVPIQQSEALKDIDIEDLEDAQSSGHKYEQFESRGQNLQNSQNLDYPPQASDEEKQIQISRIQKALDESNLIDQEIIQLTRELQIIHSSQESLLQQNNFSPESLHKQEMLAQRYSQIEFRLKQLQSVQKGFTSQLTHMHELMKKTQSNNSYMQKELQFFKQKSQLLEEKQKAIQQKQQHLKSKQLTASRSCSLSLNEQKAKPKTYHIKPKAPNNQSIQSRKYKELTFEYCFGEGKSDEEKWQELETDSQNNPPEYKLVYSFQHSSTILAVRLVDLVTNESSRSSLSSRKSGGQGMIRKNYQYLIDFGGGMPGNQSEKVKGLSKELVVNLVEERYVCKQFTRKIEVYVMICEEETYVDLIKLVPLPNPLVFYFESRFSFMGKEQNDSRGIQSKKQSRTVQNQNYQNQQMEEERQEKMNLLSNSLSSVSNLSRFMKTYIIKIQHMADVNSIQKLLNLKWVTTDQTPSTNYFTINAQTHTKTVQDKRQLFFVKIEDCVMENGPEYQSLDQRHRYSLVFRVGSTYDNELLVDLIEFLTFLTVC